jgi:hypothetical protein
MHRTDTRIAKKFNPAAFTAARGLRAASPPDNSAMFDRRKTWCAWLAAATLGCNPALNWRDARLADGALSMLLPCKPDNVTREVGMGGQMRSLSMVGCRADGATFAVSHVLVAGTEEAQAVLEGWRVAVLAHARADQQQAQPFKLPGAWDAPQATRVQARARSADGSEVALDACWFARVDAAGVHLFHAVVLAPRPVASAAQTFFGSLALR